MLHSKEKLNLYILMLEQISSSFDDDDNDDEYSFFI